MADQPKNIYQRVIEVQKAVQTVLKNEKVEVRGDRSYKAVTHDDVAALLHMPLAEAGIVLLPDVTEFVTTEFNIEKRGDQGPYTQKWYRTDIKIKVKWINADMPDDFFESTGAAFALDTSDKSFSKAYSLALKIVLLKVHLLESRDSEEQRPFENDELSDKRPAGKRPAGKSPPSKKPEPQKPAAKPKSNPILSPATQDEIDVMYSLCIERGLKESVLNLLIRDGYGVTSAKLPAWICSEICKFLGKESVDEAAVVTQAMEVKKRREAKANAQKS